MASKINIQIPKPCQENWLEMTPVEKARFCNICQKKVFDFTKASDREIIEAFNRDNNLCGHFLESQLNRYLIKPKEKNSLWLATATAVISFIGLGTNETTAQENVKVEQTDNKTNDKIIREEVEISGIVVDKNDNPIPNIGINFIHHETIAKTDNNGRFSVKVTNGTKLIFFYQDENFEYLNDNYVVNGKASNVKIICIKDIIKPLKDAFVGQAIVVKQRNFYDRIFNSIGNWFK